MSDRFDESYVLRARTVQQGMLRVERVLTSRLEFASSCASVMSHYNSHDGTDEMIDWLRETTVEANIYENQSAKYWWRCLLPESQALILLRNLDPGYLTRSFPNNDPIPRMVVDLRSTAAEFKEKQPSEESNGALCKVLRFDVKTGELVPWCIKLRYLGIGFLELSYIDAETTRRMFLEHGKLSKRNAKIDPAQKSALCTNSHRQQLY
jgi:hypothetical protein